VRAAASVIAASRPRRRSSGWRKGQTEVRDQSVPKGSQALRANDAISIEPDAAYPGSARWVAQQPGYLPPDPLTPTNLD
jgi:hypothetical protein